MAETTNALRRPGRSAPDLTDYRVVHRAMTVDIGRLADVTDELVGTPDRRRIRIFRRYLCGVLAEIESHHTVEDDYLWPLLAERAEAGGALLALTDDHGRLGPLLRRADTLAAGGRPGPPLACALREIRDLLARHVADEERDVFPLIQQHLDVDDYTRLRRQFQVNLRINLLPFLLPWIFAHATSGERPVLLSHLDGPVRTLLRSLEPRFRARSELLFG